MKVAEIARATGFADANYLAKAFPSAPGAVAVEFRAKRDGAV